jgi:hypothetical protein
MVSRGAAQRVDWVGRELGLVGCTGENGEGKRWAGMWAGASELYCKGGLCGGGGEKERKERGKLGREERIGPTGLEFPFFYFKFFSNS